MKIGIVSVGQATPNMLIELQEGLPKIFPETTCSVIQEPLPLPDQAFDKKRNQFNSSAILDKIQVFVTKNKDYQRVLGVINIDIFASGLNYVFGEAYVSGQAALISLWRLKPEFYSETSNSPIFTLRAVKEAVHELGHTLGVRHCSKNFCVMHFSNSIFDTDKKQNLLCDQCYLQAALAISNLG